MPEAPWARRLGQHPGLGELLVVVGDEVDGVLVEAAEHRRRGRGHARLGVAAGRRTVVEGAEVAVPVDQGQPHRERLGLAHEGVVDRGVPVGVVLAHDLADDAGGLDVAAVGAQPQLVHAVEDASLHRLEAVTRVGQRPAEDDRVGVLQERLLHLVGDVDVDDVLDEVVVQGRCGRATRHQVQSPSRADPPHPAPGVG